jgi:hypothetical protein
MLDPIVNTIKIAAFTSPDNDIGHFPTGPGANFYSTGVHENARVCAHFRVYLTFRLCISVTCENYALAEGESVNT